MAPDEARVATASRDNLVRIFDIQGPLIHILSGHEADVLSAEWVAKGRELITTSDDGTVRRWDTFTGELLKTVDLGDVETDTVVVINDGDALVVGNDDGKLVLIDERRSPVFINAHSAGIKRLSYDPQQHLLLSASYDRTIRLWRFDSTSTNRLTCIKSASVPDEIWLRSCAKLHEATWVFGTFGSSYAIYDSALDQWDLSGVRPTPGINSVTATSQHVMAVGDAGTVFRDNESLAELGSCCNFIMAFGPRWLAGGQLGIIFDAESGQIIHQHSSPLNCATSFTRADGNLGLIVGTYTGEALIFRLYNGHISFDFQVRLHNNAVKSLAMSDDVLFSVCATGAAAFHRLSDLTLIKLQGAAHERICNGAAAIEGGRFASVSRDLTLRIWNKSGERLTVICTPHENSIKCVTADVSGRLIATGGYRGRVAVYDMAAAKWIFNRRLSASGISSLCATPIVGTFLASSYDGAVYTVRAKEGADASGAREDKGTFHRTVSGPATQILSR